MHNRAFWAHSDHFAFGLHLDHINFFAYAVNSFKIICEYSDLYSKPWWIKCSIWIWCYSCRESCLHAFCRKLWVLAFSLFFMVFTLSGHLRITAVEILLWPSLSVTEMALGGYQSHRIIASGVCIQKTHGGNCECQGYLRWYFGIQVDSRRLWYCIAGEFYILDDV